MLYTAKTFKSRSLSSGYPDTALTNTALFTVAGWVWVCPLECPKHAGKPRNSE